MSNNCIRNYGVVVPAYNAAAVIGKCMHALMACDPPPVEIIIVNDGSTDSTRTICDSFDCTTLHCEENRGAGAARNTGLKQLTTDYAVFVDADIVVDPDVFFQFDNFFELHPTASGVSGIYNANVPHREFATRYKNIHSIESCTAVLHQPVAAMNTSLAAVKRSVLTESSGFSETVRASEDMILACQIAEKGAEFYFSDSIRMTHFKRYSLLGLLLDDSSKSYWMARHYWAQGIDIWENWDDHSGHHSASQALRIILACCIVVSASFVIAGMPGSRWLLVALILAFTASGIRLWQFMLRYENVSFALAAWPLHFMEMCIAAVSVATAGIVELKTYIFGKGLGAKTSEDESAISTT